MIRAVDSVADRPALSGANCCAELAAVRTWRHYLSIFRDDQFMWDGPITGVDWSFDSVTVNATDIIGLLDRRVPHQDFTFTGTDLTENFGTFDEMWLCALLGASQCRSQTTNAATHNED